MSDIGHTTGPDCSVAGCGSRTYLARYAARRMWTNSYDGIIMGEGPHYWLCTAHGGPRPMTLPRYRTGPEDSDTVIGPILRRFQLPRKGARCAGPMGASRRSLWRIGKVTRKGRNGARPHIRAKAGIRLDASAFPGGYQLAYLQEAPRWQAGDVVCAECAGRMLFRGAISGGPARFTAFCHDEGDPLECAECNTAIPSSYGPVESASVADDDSAD